MGRPGTDNGHLNGGEPGEDKRSRREDARQAQYERFVSASRSFSAAMRASRIERQRLAAAREEALVREREARAGAEKGAGAAVISGRGQPAARGVARLRDYFRERGAAGGA